ncbi:hypothetical protein DESUT3_29670 [Desulfuromonas versatilis]|uniref:Oxygen sensor histidine kinase NreB n=1 Tax=Desulfuromonas versatilis TaxID=2802975 RepID=A0ABN6E0N6_9BACT|nr:sensor histidine kinase [Desulfuromonas versatilis]BCR05898.1 hypothetical protein DESUT3_29670 [Desulfuromonas versatilis]
MNKSAEGAVLDNPNELAGAELLALRCTSNPGAADQGPRGSRLAHYLIQHPGQLIAALAAWVFFAEFGAMMLMAQFPPMGDKVGALLDAGVLVLVLSPAYFLFYIPLKELLVERLQNEKEIRHLSRRLLRAGEEERRHLARELHDQCSQTLTALHFGIETLKNTLPGPDEQTSGQFQQLGGLVDKLAGDLRSITNDLRPTMLDELGLGPALRWHIEEFSRLLPGVEAVFEPPQCHLRLVPEVELTLFRVCQEGLNNVARHSGAKRVQVDLNRVGECIMLTIQDDGVGFDPEHVRRRVQHPGAIGLVGMRERVAAVGGHMRIVSARRQGTRIEVRLPLAGNMDEMGLAG